MAYKICALIPTYNHHKALPSIIRALTFDVLIVNDGSDQETSDALTQLERSHDHIHVAHLTRNGGKGSALKYGLQWANRLGYTHAFQIDADGQHDLTALQSFITTSENNPHALISGQPHYDTSAPMARRLGRWMTHVWVWVETLSFQIKESMCGFRIYPLQETLHVLTTTSLGQRMEFDTEIMVRLFWRGTPSIMQPVQVTYPKDNHSNFEMLWDNWRITKMHTRLVFKMLFQLPTILKNRPNYRALNLPSPQMKWFRLKEQGTLLGLTLMFFSYRLLGRPLFLFVSFPILLYYFLLGRQQRKASRQYLSHVFAFSEQQKAANLFHVFRHHIHFLEMMVDKLGAWTGKLDQSLVDPQGLHTLKTLTSQEEGGLFLVSHLGNIDVLRAFASSKMDSKLHILLHSQNAQKFTRLLRKISPHSSVNIIEVSQIGPDLILFLKDKIQQGEWVAIAADRVPITGEQHVSIVPFLGHNAAFPQGAYILASLLGCSVHTLMIVRAGQTFRLYIEHFSTKIELHRASRQEDVEKYIKKYSARLETYCIKYPYQWFNFYSYWNETHA